MQGNRTLQAAVWMIGSILSFSLMAVAGREVSLDLDTYEINFYRSLIGCLLILAVLSATGGLHRIRARRMPMHVFRNLVHFAGQNLWFYALAVAPLAQVFALEFTMPIWAMLLSVVVLKERLTPMRSFATVAGFIGIMLITRPWLLGIGPGVAQAALAAVFFGISGVFTRLLTRTESIVSILFWLTALQTLMGLGCALWDGEMAVPRGAAIPWVVVIALTGLVAHLCLTTALKLAPAAVVMPIDFARLPLISVVGLLLYAEPIEAWVWIGAAVIFAANYANLVFESRAERPRPAPAG